MSVKINLSELKGLEDNLKKLSKQQKNEFMESSAKEMAARLLAILIKNTPTGDYRKSVQRKVYDYYYDDEDEGSGERHRYFTGKYKTVKVKPKSGKVGGTLKRGWTAKDGMKIEPKANGYLVTIINPVEYASYVDKGHRTANHQGWVEGQFFVEKSELRLEQIAAGALQAKLGKYIKGVLNGK